MVKLIVLFIVTVMFMYLSFAADHYLDGLWLKAPTVIILSSITIFNLFFLIDSTYFTLKAKKK